MPGQREADFLAALAREEVRRLDEPHPVAARAHHERVRQGRVGEVAHAAHQLAVRDAGRGDDHLLRGEIVDREDPVEVVDPVRVRVVDLGPARRPELRLKLAAEAAERGRREHCLPRAADPDREVVVRAADGGGDRGEHVAVLDQLDARAGGADLLDQVVMARPVEDDRRHVVHHPPVGVGDRADVVADRHRERDPSAGARPDRQLPHVHVRKRRHRAARPHRDHRERVVAAARRHRPALERDPARGRPPRRPSRSPSRPRAGRLPPALRSRSGR